ncbi:MAG: hypothetical protein DRI86_10425 [Bacteroidetes bacterium]|nr:MAG: hypothetical protein DRI86_10425 [Bacteroidota bacterium]
MQKFIFLLLLIVPLFVFGQKKEEKKAKLLTYKFSGFVKNDIFFDSRQTVAAREGHFLLYPKSESLDPVGEDINAQPNFNMLSIQTRLRLLVTGPDVLGAKTSAFVEGAFFGSISTDANEFRLRHAFVKLAWTNTQLLIGQYWHPLFITHVFPGTVSFNTGAPFTPFSRNPQIRLTKHFGDASLVFTALTQRDFVSSGPIGSSSSYLRNSAMPAFNLRFDYVNINKVNKTEFVIGASANYKSLLPELSTNLGYVNNEENNSLSFAAYAKYQIASFGIKFYGFYGQDAYNLTMLGGYAQHKMIDATTGAIEFTPIKTSSLWSELYYMNSNWQLGIFAGYSKNLGAVDEVLANTFYSRGSNIDYLFRVSPRLIINYGKFRIAPEIEYTATAYATNDNSGNMNRDKYGVITDSKLVGNLRILLGVYYFF